jgi:hypothetical protein
MLKQSEEPPLEKAPLDLNLPEAVILNFWQGIIFLQLIAVRLVSSAKRRGWASLCPTARA